MGWNLLTLLVSLFGVYGVILLAFGVLELYRTILFVRLACPAQGYIVREREVWTKREYDERWLRIRFHTANLTPVEFEECGHISVFNAPFRKQVGDEVPVLYDPKNPGDARRDSFSALWSMPLFYMIMGGVLAYFFGLGALLGPL